MKNILTLIILVLTAIPIFPAELTDSRENLAFRYLFMKYFQINPEDSQKGIESTIRKKRLDYHWEKNHLIIINQNGGFRKSVYTILTFKEQKLISATVNYNSKEISYQKLVSEVSGILELKDSEYQGEQYHLKIIKEQRYKSVKNQTFTVLQIFLNDENPGLPEIRMKSGEFSFGGSLNESVILSLDSINYHQVTEYSYTGDSSGILSLYHSFQLTSFVGYSFHFNSIFGLGFFYSIGPRLDLIYSYFPDLLSLNQSISFQIKAGNLNRIYFTGETGFIFQNHFLLSDHYKAPFYSLGSGLNLGFETSLNPVLSISFLATFNGVYGTPMMDKSKVFGTIQDSGLFVDSADNTAFSWGIEMRLKARFRHYY